MSAANYDGVEQNTRSFLKSLEKNPGPPGPSKNLVSQVVTFPGVAKSEGGPFTDLIASCPEGKIVTGGGFDQEGDTSIVIFYDGPSSPSSWLVGVYNTGGRDLPVKVFAICASSE